MAAGGALGMAGVGMGCQFLMVGLRVWGVDTGWVGTDMEVVGRGLIEGHGCLRSMYQAQKR